MSEICTDAVITKILNGMMDSLDDKQLRQLKDQLYICLHDVDLVKQKYELAESINDSDIIKLNYFASSLRIAKYSENTINQYLRTAKILRGFIGKDFDKITSADVKFYLAYNQKENKWADSTMLNSIHYLSSFFNFLQEEEYILKNPMIKITRVKAEKVVKNGFTPAEMEKLRLAAREEPRNAALIEFLYASGIRVNELSTLKWGDIDIKHKKLIVRGKGNKEREVLFSEKAEFYMRRYFEERMQKENRSPEEMIERPLFANAKRSPETKDFEALQNNGIRYILNQIGDRAGVKKVHPHKFRRTFATDAINRGMPIEQLKTLMGHNSYDTTLIYANIKDNKIEQSYRTYCE